ncbi:MAG: TIGR02186 family protein [Nitrospirota bacterium]|jgi:uncharacterized protein (TIGR02186 family)
MRKIKNQKSKIKIVAFIIFEFLILNSALAGELSAQLTTKVSHDRIKIDFFYHGSEVNVSGVSGHGTDIVIKLTSPEGHQVLRKKAKVAGLLWMNVGELEFDRTSNLYFLHSTQKINDIVSQDEMDRYVIGYPALKKHIEVAQVKDEDEKARWFNEFVKFKELSRLYAISFGQIILNQTDSGQNYSIKLNWPYQAPIGEYLVTVYAVKDKKVVEKAEARMIVEQVGIVKTLANMAKNNGALYGAISIVVALIAGFGVGIIFRKGGGGH